MIGQRFGRLAVVRFAGKKGKKKHWECLCDCGNTTVTYQYCLRSGRTKSCGCLRREEKDASAEMIGKRFGRLVVIGFAGKKHGHHKLWKCLCDCGNETVSYQASLRRGTTKSCGCLKAEKVKARWQNYRAKLWERLERDGDCQVWQGACNEGGYGLTSHEGEKWMAHRLAWFLENGPIPDGLDVLHHCDNPPCCNPDHLFLGTHADNMFDMKIKGRRKGIGMGSANGRAKLNMERAREIRQLRSTGLTQQVIADQYGVSQNAISKVILGHRYAG